MNTLLQVSLLSVNDEVRFLADAPGREPITVDYFRSNDDATSYTSLELLLISAASCMASALKIVIKKRLKKDVIKLEVDASGVRRESLPTDFTAVSFHIRCTSADLDDSELTELVQSAKEKICPVFAMLKDDIDMQFSVTVQRPQGEKGGCQCQKN
ncbi:MAG: OsmC family protein [Deltaproteobacteria bacterium]|nr:OsmC family protein [Deltaproteobacteria bacterium]